MGSIIAPKASLASPIGKGKIDKDIMAGENYLFLPIPYLMFIMEGEKKTSSYTASQMVNAINSLNNFISIIELSPEGLSKAINDKDFCEKYKGKQSNPFEMASVASFYDESSWGDIEELKESLNNIKIW